jgi:amylosucrase
LRPMLDEFWSPTFHRLLEAFLLDEGERATLAQRLNMIWPRFSEIVEALYGKGPGFSWHVEQMLATTVRAYAERPHDLKERDLTRPANWYQSAQMFGAMCYVDRYANTLAALRARIPYFQELGLTYLHLMPLFRCPPGQNDGGYAVSSFREVRPDLGTMQELADLARTLREAGISLVLDMVLNHTSDDHEWALRAKQGDATYQAYYRLFPDRFLPDAYERTLREVFPDQAPGNFTYVPEIQQWAWTTFHSFQWDLNYANPVVFTAMLGEMLFLANQGADVLRLDAVPFLWKELGTSCENLPQVHLLVEAWNLLFRVAAPSVVFKSEAIVHPDEVAKYIGRECQLSYNPLLMVCLWEALATRDTRLLTHSMRKRFALPPDAAWINYVRSHDDIGWGFANEDCAEIGLDGPQLRSELNAFFTGQTSGSFARGAPFNYNPKTNDMRISGTLASLAGLEAAQESGDADAIDLAIARILLVTGVTIAVGGVPLLYLGDEIGTLNDYGYVNTPAHAEDSRWLHRPAFDAARWEQRLQPGSIPARLFQGIRQMVSVRKANTIFDGTQQTEWLSLNNPQIVAFWRKQPEHQLLFLANFSEFPQILHLDIQLGSASEMVDILTHTRCDLSQPLSLQAYGQLWLCADR